MVLGVGGLRGPRALDFWECSNFNCPFPRKAKDMGNIFPFFSPLFYPFLVSQPNMADSQMEVVGREGADQSWWEVKE